PRRLALRRDGGLHAAEGLHVAGLPPHPARTRVPRGEGHHPHTGARRLPGGRGAHPVRSHKHGAEAETVSGEVELPPDTYNGMMTTLLKNLAKGAVETVHVLVFTPKPMLVQLELAPVGEDTIIAGERRLQATHYVMTPKLGVVRGAAAALLGKTPPPYHCWVVTTGAPAFVA